MTASSYSEHGFFLPYLINKATTLMNSELQKFLDTKGLTLTHWRVLAFLVTQDNLTIGALAEATMTEQSTLSRSLRVLEEHGYLKRRSSKVDNRAAHVTLQDKGRKIYSAILSQALLLESAMTADVSATDIEVVRRVLLRVIDNCIAIDQVTS